MRSGRFRNVVFPALAVTGAIVLFACEGNRTPNEPSGGPSAQPTATPVPAATPAPLPPPTPTPEPSTSRGPNNSPTVKVKGGGSCYPHPCEVTFEADAHDPDEDPLEYTWSGCTSGRKKTAVCKVDGLHEFEATVKVTDGRGGRATDTGTARGVNDAPRIQFGFPTPLRPNALNFGVGVVQDEDKCGTRDFKTELSGACNHVDILCSFSGLDLELRTTQGPGECRVKVTFRDQWGATGAFAGTYPVAP